MSEMIWIEIEEKTMRDAAEFFLKHTHDREEVVKQYHLCITKQL
jgi:hypothetical protein